MTRGADVGWRRRRDRWLAIAGLSALAAGLGACGGAGGDTPDAADGASPADLADLTAEGAADVEPSFDFAGGPLDRPVLGYLGPAAAAENQAVLPEGFTAPDATRCSSDPTRGYIAELADHPPTDSRVPFHWAPIIPGPVPDRDVVGQPELYLAGTITEHVISDLDVRLDHPYGFDDNSDVLPDPEFAFLVFHSGDPDSSGGTLHTELEQGLFPVSSSGFSPTPGDRVLMKGAWILDCGHPPYGAEMHPPTFVALARASDERTATGLAFVNPYREAQIYSADGEQAIAFDNDGRYVDAQPLPAFLVQQLLRVANDGLARLEAHALLEATRFERLSFQVCAPSPRPEQARAEASYRFRTRSGVELATTLNQTTGCLEIVADMTQDYLPMRPPRMDREWTWQQISADAAQEFGGTIDIRQRIIDALAALGYTGDYPALHEDNPPLIDGYPDLDPGPEADRDSPSEIRTGADDQPFPFHGRVRVTWVTR